MQRTTAKDIFIKIQELRNHFNDQEEIAKLQCTNDSMVSNDSYLYGIAKGKGIAYRDVVEQLEEYLELLSNNLKAEREYRKARRKK